MYVKGEVRQLKEQLAHQEEVRPSAAGEMDAAGGSTAAQQDRTGATLMDQLASRIHATVAERINQQKALFEAQDANVRNRLLLERLQARQQVRALRSTLEQYGYAAVVRIRGV